MAKTSDLSSRLEILASLDKRSYDKSRGMIDEMMKQKLELGLDDGDVKEIASKVKKLLDTGVGDVLDKQISNTLSRFTDAQKESADALKAAQASGSKESEKHASMLMKKARDIENEIDTLLSERLKQQEGADKLKEHLKPDVKKYKEAADAFGSGFLNQLNHVKSGDLAGFADGLASAVAGGLASKANTKSLAAGATTGADAAKLETAAASLTVASVGLAAAGGVLAAVIGLLVAADEQAKEFNSTMLEGAGVSDFAFKNTADVGREMIDVLQAGADAAEEMAWKYRGQTKDFTAMLGKLNAVGLTYKEMTKDAKTEAEATRLLSGYLETNFKWSKALGISADETAEAMANWSADFGMSLAEIDVQFGNVAAAAKLSGMDTKRFFSAITQSTSGMALYNNRIGEMAPLLAQVNKLLGETDATDFIKSLTKGFADESYVDRFKRIMISGVEDTRKVMIADSIKMARDFKQRFGQDKLVQDALGIEFMGLPPDQMLKQLGGKSDKQIRELVTTLHAEGKDEAARMIESTAKIAKASQGGVTEMAKGMDQLSAGGKLAMKMQGLGDKRISEMSGIELAAFEQYSGIGGEQLEQLRRLDSNLMGEWEMLQEISKHGGRTEELNEAQQKLLESQNISVDEDGKMSKKNADGTITKLDSLNDYTIAHGETLTNIASIQDEATSYAQSNVKNTASILTYLQTGMQSILKDISEGITNLYNGFMGTSKSQIDLQKTQLAENDTQQADLFDKISEQSALLADSEAKARSLDPSSQEGKDMQAQVAKQKEDLAISKAALEESKAMRSEIASLNTLQLKMAGYGDSTLGLGTAGVLDVLDAVQSKVTGTQMMEGPLDLYQEGATKMGMSNTSQALDVIGGGVSAAVKGGSGYGVAQSAIASIGKDDTTKALEAQVTEQAKTADGTETLVETTKKQAMADASWQKTGFFNASEDAFISGQRKADAEKLVRGMGYMQGTEEFDRVKGDVLAGHGQQYMSKVPTEQLGLAAGLGINTAMVNDFVMRPGSPPQKFNPSDTILGVKAGGPLNSEGGGGGMVNITVNGGDQAQVYKTVRSALKNSGIRPR